MLGLFSSRNVGMIKHSLMFKWWRLSVFRFDGANGPGHMQLASVMYKGNQRVFCAPAWHKPLGDVPMPRKNKTEKKTSEVVTLEDVDRRSLIGLGNVHDACSTSEVFRALGELGGSLNEVHIARAMSKLAAVQASAQETGESRALALRRDKDFIHLCQLALQHVTAMDCNLFTDVLKAVIDLRVPLSSVMVQTLLASAEQRLNRFNCDNLAKLASILVHLEETDQRAKALLQAAALLVPDRIGTCTHAMTLNVLLRTVGKQLDRRTHVQVALRLVAILTTKRDGDKNFKKQTVLDTAEAIIAFHSIGYHNALFLDEACEILISDIEYLPPTKLMLTLHSLSGLRYYSPGLLGKAGDVIAERVDAFTLYNLSRILRAYSSQRFLHEELLNSVAISLGGRRLDHVSLIAFIGIVSPYAKFQHCPSPPSYSGEGLFNLIAAAVERQIARCQPGRDLDCSQLVQLVALLAMCGSYSPILVQTALSRTCYESVLTDCKTLPYLRTLHTIIALDRPELAAFEGYPQSESITHSTELSHALDLVDRETRVTENKQDDEFMTSVAKLLKDETFNSRYSLAADVLISNGYTVDFVVSDTKQEKPPTAIDLTRRVHFCANVPDRPLGQEAIKRRHLEAMGYNFHMVRRIDWMALGSPRERAERIQEVLCSLPRQGEP